MWPIQWEAVRILRATHCQRIAAGGTRARPQPCSGNQIWNIFERFWCANRNPASPVSMLVTVLGGKRASTFTRCIQTAPEALFAPIKLGEWIKGVWIKSLNDNVLIGFKLLVYSLVSSEFVCSGFNSKINSENSVQIVSIDGQWRAHFPLESQESVES